MRRLDANLPSKSDPSTSSPLYSNPRFPLSWFQTLAYIEIHIPFELHLCLIYISIVASSSLLVEMSDEENNWEYLIDLEGYYAHEADHYQYAPNSAGSQTVRMIAGNIGVNDEIVIEGRPCKVVEVSISKTGKHEEAECHFVATDIFTGKKLEDTIPFYQYCDAPHVFDEDYELIDVSEDGFMILKPMDDDTKERIELPTDEDLLTKIKGGFAERKYLIVSVMSAMGENHIYALKSMGPWGEEPIYPLKDIDGMGASVKGNDEDEVGRAVEDDVGLQKEIEARVCVKGVKEGEGELDS